MRSKDQPTKAISGGSTVKDGTSGKADNNAATIVTSTPSGSAKVSIRQVVKSTPIFAVHTLFTMTKMKQVLIGSLVLVADGCMKTVWSIDDEGKELLCPCCLNLLTS